MIARIPNCRGLACGLAFGVLLVGAAAEAVEPTEIVEHVVVPGDTVFLIATQYGSTVQLVIQENQIRDVRRLFVGKRLRIPVVRVPSPQRAEELRITPASIETSRRLLGVGERQLAEARFQEALDTAALVRKNLATMRESDARALRPRLELLTATAQVALGDTDLAFTSMRRALDADPELVLDANNTPPKVLAVYRAAMLAEPAPR